MKYWLFCDITAVLLLTVIAAIYIPQIPHEYGSLYEGVRILILKEKLNAEMIWNETQHQIDENSKVLDIALNYIRNNEDILLEKLNAINNLERSDELKKCYKQYERQIARFNRDLIDKYVVCKQALNSSLSQLKNEVVTEIKYIHDAAFEIQELVYDCNVTDLKRVANTVNHDLVTLCVISKLGEINQHMFQAAQICLDIIARIRVNDMNNTNDEMAEMPQWNTNNVCLDFQYIRDEFDTIYENIMECVKEMV